ncbi:MAG: DUF2145 domain-containing protein [Burkholderiales bacterium]|nr:DUF2145 domain-containing protein [Burkholderiales bacterium]
MLLLQFLLLACAGARASTLGACNPPAALSVAERDRLLQFGALVRQTLADSGTEAALVSRSGLDLSRFGQRYSHAGVSLRHGPEAPWSVRQLYFACDEQRPRLYDQGLSAFVLGTDDAALGYVSVLLLPAPAAAALAQAALDDRGALQLLGGRYSANAYPYSTRYQNCNQWVMELLASAWGDLAPGPDERARAQHWLRGQGYQPTEFEVGSRWLMALGPLFIRWIHADDHPASDLDALRFSVSMPASIEAFVQARLPQARRIEFCHTAYAMVVHPGWTPIARGCAPVAGDTYVGFD